MTKLGDLSFDVDILAFFRNRTTKVVVNLVTIKAPAWPNLYTNTVNLLNIQVRPEKVLKSLTNILFNKLVHFEIGN